jgi:hypothetical protein
MVYPCFLDRRLVWLWWGMLLLLSMPCLIPENFLCNQPAGSARKPKLLVVVQGQCTVGYAADENEIEGGFSVPLNWNVWIGE